MDFKKLEVLDSKQKCVFCHTSEINELKLGPVYMYKNIITHYYCMLLSSDMKQGGEDVEGLLGFLKEDIDKEIKRGKRLRCSYCRKSGATLGCVVPTCKVTFHLPCGIQNNTLHQFFKSFQSYCKDHRPVQKIPMQIKLQAAKEPMSDCVICCESIESRPTFDNIWPECCKKNVWLHRDCVQRLATSAGYFFKCPLCNDKKKFESTMKKMGIYIPNQDASWESVPNAFEELLYVHDSCDAVKCLCPQGRKDNVEGTRWELVLCRLCGSQGMHIGCGKLAWKDPQFECKECTQMLQHANPNSEAENQDSRGSQRIDEPHTTTHTSVSSSSQNGRHYESMSSSLRRPPRDTSSTSSRLHLKRRENDKEEIHKEHIRTRKRHRRELSRNLLPSTSSNSSHTQAAPDYESEQNSPILISDDDEEEEKDDHDDDEDEDVVIISSDIPIKKAIITNEGRQIPVVTLKQENNSVVKGEIEVPVQIKMASYSQTSKTRIDAGLYNNNIIFENSRVPPNLHLQNNTNPVMQNYTSMPSSSFTSQNLYNNTYVLDPQTSKDFPQGSTVFQSVPPEYSQHNRSQQLGTEQKCHDISCYTFNPNISEYRTNCCSKPDHDKSWTHKYNASKYVERGYNYNRLNPKVVITPLKILHDDKGIKIIVLPSTKNNNKEIKRLMPNPTKKHKVINNNKILKGRNINLCHGKGKHLLKVKMFGNTLKKSVEKDSNKNRNKLIQEENRSCFAQAETPQFFVLNKISDTKNQKNEIFNNFNEDKSAMFASDSANHIESLSECVKSLEMCNENNTVDTNKVLADINGDENVISIINNNQSSFYDKCKKKSDTPLKENVKYQSMLNFISSINTPVFDRNKNVESNEAEHSGKNSAYSAGKQKGKKSRKSKDIVKHSVEKKLKVLKNANGTNEIDELSNIKLSHSFSAKNKKLKVKSRITKTSNLNTLDKFFNLLTVHKSNTTSVENKEIRSENKSDLLENNISCESMDKENSSNKELCNQEMSYKQNSIEKYLNLNKSNYTAGTVTNERIENLNSKDFNFKSILKVAALRT